MCFKISPNALSLTIKITYITNIYNENISIETKSMDFIFLMYLYCVAIRKTRIDKFIAVNKTIMTTLMFKLMFVLNVSSAFIVRVPPQNGQFKPVKYL